MKVGSPQFKEKVVVALADPNLRDALGQSRKGFVNGRAALVAGVPEFEFGIDTNIGFIAEINLEALIDVL